ncbi:pilin N-terminal domain-containing protein [Enterococcus sp. DIV0876]|uniref:pilin N-terminal domain-containing protein n=1 Tax=Enterococcus sp. DIV0876 TaxID=2774633 RepID=UPI003D2FCA67
MKRMMKYPILLLFLVLGFLSISELTANAASTDTQNILLHKRIFRDRDYTEQFDDAKYQNTGDIVSGASHNNSEMLTLSRGLNGATFALLDTTDYYYAKVAEVGQEQASKDLNEKLTRTLVRKHLVEGEYNFTIEDDFPEVSIVDSGTTAPSSELPASIDQSEFEDENGFLYFENVPKRSNGQHAVYMIVETAVDDQGNVDLQKWASKMMISFPVMRDTGEEFDAEILHLYPKNLGYVRDPWFMKLGRNVNGEYAPLEGTEFVFYRLNEAGEREYFIPDLTEDMSMNHEWISGIEADSQGNAVYDSLIENGIHIYRSSEYGIVSMDGVLVPSGTYYFEEVKTVPGYLPTAETFQIKVEIPSSWWNEESNDYQPVLVNGQAMAEPEPDWATVFADGFDFDKALEAAYINEPGYTGDGLPYVYNDETPLFEKSLMENKQDFAYGEIINYQINTWIPLFPEFYQYVTINDYSDGSLAMVPDSIKVRIGDDQTYITADEQARMMDLVILPENVGFTATLNLDYFTENYAYRGQEMVIEYQMYIVEGAAADQPLDNNAVFSFKHSDYDYEEITEKKTVYTGGRKFIKVDIDDPTKMLSNAQFVIQNDNNQYMTIIDGTITWLDDSSEALVMTSDESGHFEIQGLNYGDYQLVETKAPENYQLLKDPVTFTIEQNSYQLNDEATIALAVGNKTSTTNDPGNGPDDPSTDDTKGSGFLPQTGEITNIFLVVLGSILVWLGVKYYRKNLQN